MYAYQKRQSRGEEEGGEQVANFALLFLPFHDSTFSLSH